MNDLENIFSEHKGHRIHKWHHYLEIYDRHFSRFRGQQLNLLEIGVSHGGSLQMWKSYFGSGVNVFGMDINPNCKRLEEERVQIFIGDQADRSFLQSVKDQTPALDILIDDGGHTMEQQINTFEVLFPHVKDHGIYLIEDLHTSYAAQFGGGIRRPGTFIEYSKNFIDDLHAWHSEQPDEFGISDLTRSVHSLHYYDSMLVMEKRPVSEPYRVKVGKSTRPKKRLW